LEACGSRTSCLKNRLFKVIVCIITLVAFLFTIVPPDMAWALTMPQTKAVNFAPKAAPAITEITIPEYLGVIKESWSPQNTQTRKSDNPQTIIHIQDAHCNYYAQLQIARIVGYLQERYGISQVNLEGGKRDYDLSALTGIKDVGLRAKALEHFMKEGVINGAEYFAANNPKKASLWGIEDTGLYIENLKVYLDSLADKTAIDRYLKNLTSALSNLKTRIYSRDLITLDRHRTAFKNKKLGLKEYFNYLTGLSSSQNVDTSDLTNIQILLKTLTLEKDMDFKESNAEREGLIDKLGKVLSRDEVRELVGKAVEFRTGRISAIKFHSYLLDKAKELKIPSGEYKNLILYTVYLGVYSNLDNDKLFEEAGVLARRVSEKLFQDTAQNELYKLSEDLDIIKDVLEIALTSDEHKYFRDHRGEFDMKNYLAFVNDKAQFYGLKLRLGDDILKLNDHLERMEKFYLIGLERDEAFIKNLKFNSRGRLNVPYAVDNSKAAILITGGFHAKNLAGLFKKKKISYISIMPNFKEEEGYECPYLSLLSGRKRIVLAKEVKKIAGQSLAYCSQQTSLADDVKGLMPAANIGVSSATSPMPDTVASPSVPSPTIMSRINELLKNIVKTLFGVRFSADQEKIIQAEAKEVVDILLPGKDTAEKGKRAQELAAAASLNSIPVMFINTLTRPISGRGLLCIIAAAGIITGGFAVNSYSMPAFPELLICFTAGTAAVWALIFTGTFIEAWKPHITVERAYIPVLVSRSFFINSTAHELTHLLKRMDCIQTDLPAASAIGTLRAFEREMLEGSDKAGFDYGLSVERDKKISPEEKHAQLISWAKRRGCSGSEVEPPFTYPLGAALAGYGYALSLETGNPGDPRKFIYLISKGISPLEAERAIRSTAFQSGPEETPQAESARIDLPLLVEDSELMKRLTAINGGKRPHVINIYGGHEDTLPVLKDALNAIPQDESDDYIAVTLKNTDSSTGVTTYSLIADRASYIINGKTANNEKLLHAIWAGRAEVGAFEFVFRFSVVPADNTIAIESVSIGRVYTADLRSRHLVSRFFKNFAKTLEQNYRGMDITATSLEDFHGAGVQVIPYLMRKYFSAQKLKKESPVYSGRVGKRRSVFSRAKDPNVTCGSFHPGVENAIYEDEQDGLLRAAGDVLDKVRPINPEEESRVLFIPIDMSKLRDYSALRADIKHAFGMDFSNMNTIFYDGTERGLMEAAADPKYGLNRPGTLALAYIDEKAMSGEAAESHNKNNAAFKIIREEAPRGVAKDELFMHVAFGLPVLDYVKGNSNETHMMELWSIIERMVKNPRELKNSIETLFKKGFILALKKITKININKEIEDGKYNLREVLTKA